MNNFGSKIIISVPQNFRFRFTSGGIRTQKTFPKFFYCTKRCGFEFGGEFGGGSVTANFILEHFGSPLPARAVGVNSKKLLLKQKLF